MSVLPRASTLALLITLIACRQDEKLPADTATPPVDADGDGYFADATGTAEADCDDEDPAHHPGATETCDGYDDDCDGAVDEAEGGESVCAPVDADGDGYPASVDCDDDDSGVHPDADEHCGNDRDEDCDGLSDEGDAAEAVDWSWDEDGDGYGDAGDQTSACADEPPDGYVLDASDCDDGAAAVNPGATERCNLIDDDCDGLIDDADDSVFYDAAANDWYMDQDDDHYGDPDHWILACELPEGAVDDATDCDDTRSDVNPSGVEVCDDEDADEDCDGFTEDADSDVVYDETEDIWYFDDDDDAYGDPAISTLACAQPDQYVENSDDCAPDDVELPSVWTIDADADGYGSNASGAATLLDCAQPTGEAYAYVENTDDCDDGDDEIGPYFKDSDNDGLGGDTMASTCAPAKGVVDNSDDCDDSTKECMYADEFYWDEDGDGYGDAAKAAAYCPCNVAAGYVATDTDCDDTTASVSPTQTEICDGLDNDCDTFVDDDDTYVADPSTWYRDRDEDGYGDASRPATACVAAGVGGKYAYVASDDDCDDVDGAVHPDAAEVCDGADTDCDGLSDAYDVITDGTDYYPDTDGDGYGDGTDTTPEVACSAPANMVANNDDCDDDNELFYPGADETCDGRDEDCDGVIDSEEACGCTFMTYGDHSYLLCAETEGTSETDLPWDDANAWCAGRGYYLTAIGSAGENDALGGWMTETGIKKAYIGLWQEGSDRFWRSLSNMNGTPDCSEDADALVDADGAPLYDDPLEGGAGSCGLLKVTDDGYIWPDSECGSNDERAYICESCDPGED